MLLSPTISILALGVSATMLSRGPSLLDPPCAGSGLSSVPAVMWRLLCDGRSCSSLRGPAHVTIHWRTQLASATFAICRKASLRPPRHARYTKIIPFGCLGVDSPEPGMRRCAMSSGLDARDQIARTMKDATVSHEPKHDAVIRGIFRIGSQTRRTTDEVARSVTGWAVSRSSRA